jgi:hypothetical protein
MNPSIICIVLAAVCGIAVEIMTGRLRRLANVPIRYLPQHREFRNGERRPRIAVLLESLGIVLGVVGMILVFMGR